MCLLGVGAATTVSEPDSCDNLFAKYRAFGPARLTRAYEAARLMRSCSASTDSGKIQPARRRQHGDPRCDRIAEL